VSRTPEENERIVQDGFAAKIRAVARRVPFIEDAIAAYRCARDPATPLTARLAIMAALAYFVIPLDAIPDVIAVLGFTDDAAVFWAAWRTIKPHVTDAHRAAAKVYLDGGTEGEP